MCNYVACAKQASAVHTHDDSCTTTHICRGSQPLRALMGLLYRSGGAHRNERKKSAMKMRTRDMTTAEVVDSPTPLAPPVVVKPHEQLTCRPAQ